MMMAPVFDVKFILVCDCDSECVAKSEKLKTSPEKRRAKETNHLFFFLNAKLTTIRVDQF